MRLKKLFLASLATFAMASCSESVINEELEAPDLTDEVIKNETTSFVKISLVTPTVTRADESDYEAGSADENKVKEIRLVFFDAGRNYVSRTTITLPNKEVEEGEGNGHTVERILTTVAEVNLPANINFPKYVLAYVNPTSAKDDLATDKLEDVIKYIRDRNTVSPEGYRSMNNSVYFSENTGYVRFATEFDYKKQFFTSKEEAKKSSAIDIYVERVEAKVRLKNGIAGITSNPVAGASGVQNDENNDAVGYSLKFVPETWFVNGTEKRTFLIKNYRATVANYKSGHADFGNDFGRTLEELKTSFSQGAPNDNNDEREKYVNDERNTRSYWALDPTYFEGDNLYPAVSYDVKYGSVNTSGKSFPLEYQSYTAVAGQKESTNYLTFENGKKTSEYVLENTMNRATLQGTNAKASMSSVVLLGHYVITDAEGKEVFNGSETDKTKEFYVRHEGNGSKYIMLSDEEAINYFIERSGNILFVEAHDAEGNEIDGYEPLRAAHIDGSHPEYGVSYEDFALVYPDKDLAKKILSEQWRTLALKLTDGVPSKKLFIFDFDNNEYRNITVADMPALNERMYSAFGVLERFQSGKAYFNVPLKHIWGSNMVGGANSNKFEGDKVRLGDYGVVRNHIYDLTINSISGLGTGIGDIEQPIVPPTETEQYYINARLNILKWRVVGQSVDL